MSTTHFVEVAPKLPTESRYNIHRLATDTGTGDAIRGDIADGPFDHLSDAADRQRELGPEYGIFVAGGEA